jgi:Zn-dependent protease with chaperone function
MDPDGYSALVSRVEDLARSRPRELRRRVFLMIVAGYAYVFAILLAVLLAVVGAVVLLLSGKASGLAFQLLVPLGALVGAITRSLWVPVAPPDGRELSLARVPVLARRVDEIRSALSAPRADAVLLTTDFNASVVQVPRLGIFGWPKTYLVLGVPLMFSLERLQFDAVLAHEFAHLSGSHPKRGLWVYRMGATWQQLVDRLHAKRRWGRQLFQSFAEWYAPRLQAYGFVLSRRDEYEADADAARITGAVAMGEALVASGIRSSAVQSFWRDIWSTAESEQTPPARTWSLLPSRLREGIPPHLREELLASAFTRQADESDTHPSLTERLQALGLVRKEVEAALSRPLDTSAGTHYFGDAARDLLVGFDAEWRQSVDETWKSRHVEMSNIRTRMEELLVRDTTGPQLNSEELWELATLVDQAGDQMGAERHAETYYRRLLAKEPRHASAHFNLGRLLLSLGDATGIQHLEAVMSTDPDVTPAACAIMHAFYAQLADQDSIAKVRRVQYEYEQAVRAAAAERERVSRRDTLVSAGLAAEDVARLERIAADDRRIGRLWAVRKVTVQRADTPHLVVVVEPRWWRLGSWGRDYDKLAQDVADRIHLSVSCDFTVVVAATSTAWLVRKVKRVSDAPVYAGN